MKFGILKFLVYLVALSATFFGMRYVMGWLEGKPCDKPIEYSLGSFDERFGLSRENFLSAIAEAEGIWEKTLKGTGASASKELFSYSPGKGDLKINLVYDYRQQATKELNNIEREVKTDEAAYRLLEQQYKSLKAEHAALQSQYDAAVALFDSHNESYEEAVKRWNSGNRSSRKEFEELENARKALEAEISSLKSLESKLNGVIKEINALVAKLNSVAKELNLNVEEYNEVGAARGETFTGGLYTYDQGKKSIDIFEFESRTKLVRVLAHELGHALGLEHIADRDAIMFELNRGDAAIATPADAAALKALCAQ